MSKNEDTNNNNNNNDKVDLYQKFTKGQERRLRSLPIEFEPKTIDDKTTQVSYDLPKGAKVVYVNDINDPKSAIVKYEDMKELTLTEEEKKIAEKNFEEMKQKNPKAHDGDQTLVTNAVHDTKTNTVYLEAKRTKYSVLTSITSKKFPTESKLYQTRLDKTGVLTPIVTSDGHTVILERNDAFKLWSVPGGFCQPVNGKMNGLPNQNIDAFTLTATIEAVEEVLGDEQEDGKFKDTIKNADNSKDLRSDVNQFSKLKMEHLPEISSVSIRQTSGNPVKTIEFVAPIMVDCTKEQLDHHMKNNKAKDRKEHTGQYEIIDCTSEEEIKKFQDKNHPGNFLYNAVSDGIHSYVRNNQSITTEVKNPKVINLKMEELSLDQ